MIDPLTLAGYGWTAFFQSQLTLDEAAGARPVRVVAVHRNALEVEGPVATRRGQTMQRTCARRMTAAGVVRTNGARRFDLSSDEARLSRRRKLLREEASFGRMVERSLREKRRREEEP